METKDQWCDCAFCSHFGKIGVGNIKVHSYIEKRFYWANLTTAVDFPLPPAQQKNTCYPLGFSPTHDAFINEGGKQPPQPAGHPRDGRQSKQQRLIRRQVKAGE